MNAYDVIQKPLLSEKCYAGIANKKYVFVVAKDATKTDVKQAIEQIYNVQVEYVNIVNVTGKIKRQGRTEGRTASFKKAYVQLEAKSKPIEFFESLS